ncbi:MAG: DUF2227 family putative metal-binding protein [Simkaniaceae bacterium]|nr:DUF2227 family putative metal-binding protein [Simkaniaceae bacterium]
MSNYRGHTLFNLCVALPLLIAVGVYFFTSSNEELLVFSGVFTYTTLFMSPDMDVANKIKLLSVRGILSIPFRLYAYFFRHRGISHSVLFGSLTRILWLLGCAAGIFFLVYSSLPTQKTLYKFYYLHRDLIHLTVLAIVLADLCHLLLDLKK